MESIEVAKIKPGQSLTLTFGDAEVIMTKLEEPKKFKLEEYGPEEKEVYLLDDEIAEDEPLRYSFVPFPSLEAALKANEGKFGINRVVWDFLGRTVDSIEGDEEEEEEDEEEEDEEEKEE